MNEEFRICIEHGERIARLETKVGDLTDEVTKLATSVHDLTKTISELVTIGKVTIWVIGGVFTASLSIIGMLFDHI